VETLPRTLRVPVGARCAPARPHVRSKRGMSTRASARTDRVASAVVIALVLFLGLVAVVLAAGSFASYASVKAHLDSFASDGDADVSRADFDRIVARLRIAALVAAFASVAVHMGRRRLRRRLAELAAAAVSSVSSLYRGLHATLARESRLHLGALGAIIFTAFLLRLEFLFQPMRYDESVTFVHYASRPWYIAMTNYTAPNNHVLHSLLVHASTLVFGGDPWAIRLPAFIAGILLVPAAYVAARALYGRYAALVTAGLVASSSVLVEYSTNARGYTILALVFMLLLALATHLRSSPNPAEWLAFAVLGAVGFYTVPVMLYAFGAVVVWLAVSVWTRDRSMIARRLLPSVLVTAVLSLLLYSPIVASSGLDALAANEFVQSLSWSTFTSELPDSLVDVAKQWHRDVPLPLALVLGAAFVTAVVFHRRVSRSSLAPVLAVVAWIGPALVAQRVVPFERVWLFLVPLYLMTAAAGLCFLLRPLAARVGGEGVIAVVLAMGFAGGLAANAAATQAVYESEETSTFRDGEPVSRLIAERLRVGDKLLVAPPADAILEYHLGRRGLDPAALLYWQRPGDTTRLIVVVSQGPRDYSLAEVLADPRLDGTRLSKPMLVRQYEESSVYEVRIE
jgi:Dolichyl-phosphate-mannose-protein mannosyltransferase